MPSTPFLTGPPETIDEIAGAEAVSGPGQASTRGDAMTMSTDTTKTGLSRAPDTADSDGVTWELPSWDEVVRTHSARVYRLAYRLTGNAHDAEDLTQETFVRVFRSLATYRPGTFEGWLHRITTNLFLDGARRKARIRFDALGEAGERIASSAAGPDRVVLDARFDADVEAALAALPRDFRVAVVLADIEQIPYEEIAEILGVKIGTVRSRIHRGRSQLRSALDARDPRHRRGRNIAAAAAHLA